MREKIETLIEKLESMRSEVVERYLNELEHFSPSNGGMNVIERANILHDLDKHLTNLHMELKRIDGAEAVDALIKGVSRG